MLVSKGTFFARQLDCQTWTFLSWLAGHVWLSPIFKIRWKCYPHDRKSWCSGKVHQLVDTDIFKIFLSKLVRSARFSATTITPVNLHKIPYKKKVLWKESHKPYKEQISHYTARSSYYIHLTIQLTIEYHIICHSLGTDPPMWEWDSLTSYLLNCPTEIYR